MVGLLSTVVGLELALIASATIVIGGGVATIIAAISAVIAAAFGAMNRRKIQEVHLLVNSQLSDVMRKLELVTAERDKLDDSKPAPDAA